MRLRRTPVVLVIAALGLAGCTSSSGSGAAGSSPVTAPSTSTGNTSTGSPSPTNTVADWPMYHRDPTHSGVAASMPAVRTLAARARITLDGEVYASPIVVDGLTVVATENDVVYGLDGSYRQLWKVDLGDPSPAEERQCGNITPLGITGTPVYDRGTGLVYLVAELKGDIRHQLIALDPATGATKWRRSVDLPGVSARDMQQRGALAVAHGRVWVSFGAQAGDCGDYKGRVVGVNLDGSGAPVAFTPPTKRGGGVWNPAGPTVGPEGDLLVVSANGAAFPGDAYDYTNSVIRIDGSAKRVDSFAPSDWAVNNRDDVGLGSQGVALVGTRWAVLGGKSGPVYVLDRTRLGGIGGQVSVKNICRSFGGAAVSGDVVYLPCTDGVRAVRVTTSGTLQVLWHAAESVAGSPVVGGGRVWVLDASGGRLHALDPRTGKTMEQLDVGEMSRFATPAVRGGDVLVPTLRGLTVARTS